MMTDSYPKATLMVSTHPKPQLRGMVLEYPHSIPDSTLDKANYRLGGFLAQAVHTLDHLEEFNHHPQAKVGSGRFVAVYLDRHDDDTLVENLPMPLADYVLIQTVIDSHHDAITSIVIEQDEIIYTP